MKRIVTVDGPSTGSLCGEESCRSGWRVRTKNVPVPFSPIDATARRGLVLVVVTVVIIMVSLAGFSFVAMMSTEHKAVRMSGDALQAAAAVTSGEEFINVLLQEAHWSGSEGLNLYDNAELFRGVPVFSSDTTGSQVYFSVISPATEEEGLNGFRFGLTDESNKLNLGALLVWDQVQSGSARNALMQLPNMTESTADAILDWIDVDRRPRSFGAESSYYLGLNPPYQPRNGLPDSLEELLLVRGVTRELLFGLDRNANYQLEESELQQADAASDTASSDGLPWAQLLTLYSADRNVTADNQPRINVNNKNLRTLYNQLGRVLDDEWARFIIAYRQYGPYAGSASSTDNDNYPIDFSAAPRFAIPSLLDLIGVNVRVSDKTPRVILASPFSSEEQEMTEYLPKLLDALTTIDAPVIAGRINVNTAPRIVLAAIPGLSEELVDQIISARSGESESMDAARLSPAWLLTEHIVSLETMKQILPYLTTRGDVYRGQIVGFWDRPAPVKRVEVVIDSTGESARRVYWKDLQILGPGYSREILGAEPSFSSTELAQDGESTGD